MLSVRGNLRLLVVMMTMTLRSVSGHGRLVEPPSRSSMWRYGFNTPHNYDDNALNCGGLNVGTFQTAPLIVRIQVMYNEQTTKMCVLKLILSVCLGQVNDVIMVTLFFSPIQVLSLIHISEPTRRA